MEAGYCRGHLYFISEHRCGLHNCIGSPKNFGSVKLDKLLFYTSRPKYGHTRVPERKDESLPVVIWPHIPLDKSLSLGLIMQIEWCSLSHPHSVIELTTPNSIQQTSSLWRRCRVLSYIRCAVCVLIVLLLCFVCFMYVCLSMLHCWQVDDNFLRQRFRNKTKLAMAAISNCVAEPNHRGVFLKELMKHMPVDVYGGCGDKGPCPGHFGMIVVSCALFIIKNRTQSLLC